MAPSIGQLHRAKVILTEAELSHFKKRRTQRWVQKVSVGAIKKKPMGSYKHRDLATVELWVIKTLIEECM